MSKKYYDGTGTNKRFAMHSAGNEYRDNGDDELDDFFDDLFFVKTRIALAIESLFKALMSRSMRRSRFRSDHAHATHLHARNWRGIHRLELFERVERLRLRGGAERARHMHNFRKIPGQCTYDARDRMLSGPH